MGRKTKWLLILFFLSLLVTGCVPDRYVAVKNGEIIVPAHNDLIRLKGEWTLYENQLYTLKDLENKGQLSEVPGFLDHGTGFGTYHLKIQFPEEKVGTPQALYLPKIYTAYRVYINHDLLGRAGEVSKKKSNMVSSGYPQILYFVPHEQNMNLVLQISGFHYRKAGLSGDILIGTPERMEDFSKRITILEWFSIGALFIMGITQLTMYFYRRTELLPLYFGIFCFLTSFRTLLKGNSDIFFLLPNFSWELGVRLDYLVLFIGAPLVVKYFSYLFPNTMDRIIFKISLCISSISLIAILFTDAFIFTNTIYLFYLLLLIIAPHLIFILVKGMLAKQEGSFLIGSLFIVFLGTIVNDILHNEQVISTIQLTSLGLVVFCGAQSYVISKRFSTALFEVEELKKELEDSQKEILFTLGEITENRSKETGNHVKRVAKYSELLAHYYGLPFKKSLMVKLASPMHDVGKVAISDAILKKPGRLTNEEYEVMKTHTTIGYNMLRHSKGELMEIAAIIAYTHHEKVDGSGYPNGLKGEEIPFYGRITAIADVFDALGSDRVYKKAWELERIVEYFENEKGKHFDSHLVDLFLENIDEFVKVRDMYRDD